MTEYTPSRWAVVEITKPDGEPLFKVFGSWSGGYLDGDSWKLNSGVTSVEEDGDYILFHGFSGSVYRVHKDAYGATPWAGGVLINMLKDAPAEILPEDTDWLSLLVGQQ